MKMTSFLIDLKPHQKLVLSYPMDRLYRLSQWSYQKLWWLAKVVGMVAWKLFLFGDEITHPWHHGVYTQIFLLLRHTSSSLDSFSHQQSQSRWQQSKLRSFPVLVYYSRIKSFSKWIQFILEHIKQFAENTKPMSHTCRIEKNFLNRYNTVKAAGEHPENIEEEYRRQYYAALDRNGLSRKIAKCMPPSCSF